MNNRIKDSQGGDAGYGCDGKSEKIRLENCILR